MERQFVKSRILRSVGYDRTTKTLEIEFQSGIVYLYSGVPSKVHAELIRSDPIGQYFSDKIRNRFQAKQVAS
ncbi:MAG: KTSC domain-containing protein [Methanospirillum sp.]